MDALKQTDPEIYDLIRAEERYEIDSVRLIPSENYVSRAVLEATGSILTNKYSEGYSGRRYYEGQRYIDQIETLVAERARTLFGADHANVQPYSGSPANLAVYLALLKPGDTLMGLALPHGGHLTHGWPVSATGIFWRAVHYQVDRESQRIDYDAVRDLAKKERPKIIVTGATAYPRQFDFKIFGEIAKEVGAFMLADISHISGLIVAGAHPDAVPYADVVTTTTHKTLRGPRGAMILCRNEFAEKIDKAVFPGLQGGPHNHTTAAIGVALKEAATPAFKEYGRQIVRNAKAMAEELLAHGFNLVSGGTDNHLILIDLTNNRLQLQHRTLRSAKALQPQRPASGHTGGDFARDGRGRDASDRAMDRPGDRARRRRSGTGANKRRGDRDVPALPGARDRDLANSQKLNS